ncbi:MAG TPA: amidohydrolase family protein [Acidimicrobiales bacterium]|nr:amidohydrolase family protein [Acidimicrobiales bacterium]
MSEEKIWAHSGDSHFIEPEGLWNEILPPDLASRMPWSERSEDGATEIVHVDGESFRRELPKIATKKVDGLSMSELSSRPPGARDLQARLADLDQEGIWGEVVYSSLGLWEQSINDRALIRAASEAENEWKVSEIQGVAPNRLVAVASIPLLDVDDAVECAARARELGLYAVSMPTPANPNSATDTSSMPLLNSGEWEPLWATLEDLEMVAAFHIGGDPGEHTMYRGPGGAVLNYTNSTYSGQRAAMLMVASGALDRHPGLKVLISEGGASWVPFLGDRMEEGYRQHAMFVRPTLSRSPKEILFEQVYCSFQHEASAVQAHLYMGYENVMWGSDYPHLEGTFGHTQKTLHELFDDIPDEASRRIRTGAFEELFPHVRLPADKA